MQLKCSFTPYEGDEPYIFFSYKHTDAPTVFEILEKLNDAGFRIWYDEGLEWGQKWTQDLENHIVNCDVVMAFISAEYNKSPHCKREIDCAKSNKKILFPIHLEPLEEIDLSPELEVFNFIQAAKFYEYKENREKFFERLIDATALRKSQGQATTDWLIDIGCKYLQQKNFVKAFDYLKRASDRGNVLAWRFFREILKDSPFFKSLEKNAAAYSAAHLNELINQPQKYRRESDTKTTSSTDSARFKSLSPIPLSPVFKEFEDVFKKS